MKLHVASYVRRSFGRINGSEASPARQRKANRARFDAYAIDVQRQGYPAVRCDHYEDVGISGFSGKERPDFERLLRGCRLNRSRVIVVYNISRLSRLEPRDAVPVVNEPLSLGVTSVSTHDGVFRPGDTTDLIHPIFHLDGACQESKNRSQAVKDTAAQARAPGGYVGGKEPYGLKLHRETRTYVEAKPIAVQLSEVEQARADVIRRVRKAIQEHNTRTPSATVPGNEVPGSIGAVRRTLNEERVPTLGAARGRKTAGSSWHPRTPMLHA